jgi:glutamate-ammonia-ligase adenylyltransferase
MPNTRRFVLPTHWPLAASSGAAERLIERISAIGPAEQRLAHGLARPMLAALGGNSPYLADLACREHVALRLLAQRGPDAVVDRAMATLAAIPPTWEQARLARQLREAKRQIALATAIADIGGIWTLDQVTTALSGLAEAALHRSVAHLLRAGHDRGDLALSAPSDPETGSGFVVLAMGKLGAGELNYSSDIDLVLLHDPDAGVYRGDQCSGWFSRLARNLVTLMEARDSDGYVFRTDLRLRPDPAATPPSMSIHAALAYYESMGQNWERAAMLKARPIAGDLAMGEQFLEAIRPFIWRRHLDFAAVADIHAMKRRIDEHKKTALSQEPDPVTRILGHNVKLGQGGIREIEFLAQTLQLVWGGRNPVLREKRTLVALRLLVRAGHVRPRAASELASAYRFLRTVEHRLQMVADRQIHTLPENTVQMEAFAVFMGYPDAAGFAATFLRHLDRVQQRYAEVFSAVPGGVTHPGLDFSGADPAPATLEALAAMGFAHPDRIANAVSGWLAGRVRALRSHRSRDLLGLVLPRLLEALARQRQPDAAFMRFAGFLEHLPAGVQLLSMLQRNLDLVGRIADVLGAAPHLADHLARTPSALEGLLDGPDPIPPARLLRNRLALAKGLEDSMATIRSTVREANFAISVATLEGRIDADEAGLRRANVADAALAALLPRVLSDFAERFGRVAGGQMAVVLLGKAGGRETMAGSDLDLMLIYDRKESATESRGAKRLPAGQWFIRAVHAFIAALTAPDAEGPMYDVDMRLRPSGNKGPVAVPLAGFEAYHKHDAWTWERMALTRARVVAGPPKLRAHIEAVIRIAITSGDPAKTLPDIAHMRGRLARELPPSGPWDVKHRAGGQMEVEFIAQALQLLHGPVSPTLRLALAGLRDAGHLARSDANLLIRADRVWRSVQGMFRLIEGARPPKELSEATAASVLRSVGEAGIAAVDLPALRAILDDMAQQVRACFTRIIGPIPP